jgi:hypothetical protein
MGNRECHEAEDDSKERQSVNEAQFAARMKLGVTVDNSHVSEQSAMNQRTKSLARL